jgi:hypothetical protein
VGQDRRRLQDGDLKNVPQTFTIGPMSDYAVSQTLRPGQVLARGVCRHLLDLDFVTVEELTPAAGLRVDVMAMGPRGELWVVECKSSRADFTSDRKWDGYLEWCDRYFWAVDSGFPIDLLPEGTGLIIADGYDAEILRMPEERRLAPARRRVMVQKFARHAALRWHAARDPGLALGRV